jgi:hypothetical protein
LCPGLRAITGPEPGGNDTLGRAGGAIVGRAVVARGARDVRGAREVRGVDGVDSVDGVEAGARAEELRTAEPVPPSVDVQPASSAPTATRTTMPRMPPPSHIRLPDRVTHSRDQRRQ